MKETKFNLELLNQVPLGETFYEVARYNEFEHSKVDILIVNTPKYAIKVFLNDDTFQVIELKK